MGPLGGIRGVGDVRSVLGAGRECRYSGARRGIGSLRGHWGSPRGVKGPSGGRQCQGCIGAGRECTYSGARRGIGSLRGHWGSPRGVKGPSGGHQGVGSVRGVLGLAGSVGTHRPEGI